MKARKIAKIHYSSCFEKAFKKLPKQQQKIAVSKERIFRDNAIDLRLKTHRLHGRLKDHWSFSISHKYRILFVFVKSDEVLFLDVGGHAIYQ